MYASGRIRSLADPNATDVGLLAMFGKQLRAGCVGRRE
jgi:hypothetical protein